MHLPLTHPLASQLPACSYGFVVFQDPAVTDIAIAGLHGLKMGDRTLTVRRAAEVRWGSFAVGAGSISDRQAIGVGCPAGQAYMHLPYIHSRACFLFVLRHALL